MPQTNLKLQLAFEFEIAAPEAMLVDDHAALCRKLSDLLGPITLQGMPTITGKQLAKAGASIVAHHYHLDVENLSIPAVNRATLIAAAPHLTDTELTRLGRQVSGKTPTDGDELRRFLRKQALALVNEYRLVPCEVEGKLKSGGNISEI